MVKRCAAKGCNAKENQGLMLFKFPKEPERRMKWILLVNRANWQPITNSVLCEIHFGNEQWEQKRIDGSRRLKWSAVPSLLSSKENSVPAIYNPIVNEHNYCHLPGSSSAEMCGSSTQFDASVVTASEAIEENNIEVSTQQILLGYELAAGLTVTEAMAEDTVELSEQQLEPHEKLPPTNTISETTEENTVEDNQKFQLESNKFDSLSVTEIIEQRDTIRTLQQELRLKDEQLAALQKKFDAMQKVTKRIYTSYCNKRKQNDAMRSKVRRLQNLNQSSDASVASRLRQDQFEGLRSKTTRGKQWSIPTIIDGLMYKMKWGAQDYSNFVKDFPIFPAVRTLQRLAHKVQHVKFETGK